MMSLSHAASTPAIRNPSIARFIVLSLGWACPDAASGAVEQ
jgi:hypothetical protein